MWLESVYFMVVLTKIPLLPISLYMYIYVYIYMYIYIYTYMMVNIIKLKDNIISQIKAHA